MANAAMSVKARGAAAASSAPHCRKSRIPHAKSVTATPRFSPDLAPGVILV
jgi:hypothetical protein